MDNLIKVGSSRFKLDQAYKFNDSSARKIPFGNVLYAAAKFGGPIAITADPWSHLLLTSDNEVVLHNVLIFYNNGELIREIPKADLHKAIFQQKSNPLIVGMGFLKDETLFLISKQGIYNLINPYTGENKVYSLRDSFQEENLIEAKVFENGCIFYTLFKGQLYKFYLIKDINNPVIREFQHSELRMSNFEMTQNKLTFLPIPASCSFSQKIECFVTHHKLGAYRLIEDEPDRLEFVNAPSSTLKKLPEIKEIVSMALSPIEDTKPKKIAILNKNNVVHVIIIDVSNYLNLEFKVPILGDTEDEKKVHWCGENSLVLTCGKYFIPLTLDGEFKRQTHRSTGYLVVSEMDCARFFSSDKCDILKLVPDKYSRIFNPVSRAKSTDLYNAYLENEQRNPSPENNIIEDKKGLEEGVMELLQATYYEITPENQKLLLRAAAFGKSFLNKTNSSFNHDYFTEVCRNLRVLNALRSSKAARVITYQQLQYLDDKPSFFIYLLTKYHLFHLANEVAKFLGYNKEIVSYIYTTWACVKIERHPSDEFLSDKIFERLKNDENASYVEVAHKAYESLSSNEKSRKELALKIISYEPSLQKKVPVLLWMEQYEKALIESCKALDPNLIDLVILKLNKDPESGLNMWKVVGEHPRARPRLFKFVTDFKYNRFRRFQTAKGKKKEKTLLPIEDADIYLEKFATMDERAAYQVWRCHGEQYEDEEEFQDPRDKKIKYIKRCDPLLYEDKVELLTNALTKFKLKNVYLNDIMNLYKTVLSTEKTQEEKPILDLLRERIVKGKESEITKKYQISDRFVFLTKFRLLLEGASKQIQGELIDKLMDEKNKKGDLVNFLDISIMLQEVGFLEKAEKYALKIKDWDDQLFMLKNIATSSSINSAIDQCIAQKKWGDLPDIGNFIQGVLGNPAKYPNARITDDMISRIEKALTARK